MDAVVIGTIIALTLSIAVFAYLAYHFFKIIGGKDDTE